MQSTDSKAYERSSTVSATPQPTEESFSQNENEGELLSYVKEEEPLDSPANQCSRPLLSLSIQESLSYQPFT